VIRIDAHLHVWDLASGRYPWPDESVPEINHDVGVGDALPLLDEAGVHGAVLVQAADHEGETPFLLAQADAHPRVVGVVGWVPLDRPAEAATALEQRDDRFVGVRALIHTYADPDWILGVDDGLAMLADAGVAFDYVTGGHEALGSIPVLSDRHPDLRIVIDHLGKPPIGGDAAAHAAWRRALAAAAENPLVAAKVSGLYSAVGALDSWTPEQVRPFVADALDILGPDRLLYGGDWPVSQLAGGYARTWDALSALVAELAPGHADGILGGNAARIYRLDPRRLALAGEE
jgi:L-fuconolactonase